MIKEQNRAEQLEKDLKDREEKAIRLAQLRVKDLDKEKYENYKKICFYYNIKLKRKLSGK